MFDQLFGTKDERLERYFYSILSYSLGLPNIMALEHGSSQRAGAQRLPLKTTWVGNNINSFSITGNKLIPQFLMKDDTSNVYFQIDRDISVPRNHRYAFDFSQIQEGTLSGKLVPEGHPKLMLSDECRKLLNIIYHSGAQQWTAIPLPYAEHGAIYAGTGIPDRIYLQLPTAREATPAYRNNIMQNISNVYRIGDYDHIAVQVQQDRATSSMNFQAYFKQPELDPQPVFHDEVSPHSENIAPQTQEIPSVDPQFPFDYYRSIGLIDDDGMVTVQTFIGPLRVPANSESGMEYLLKFGQQD